ncbi:MAG: glycine--tRNA ligase subunit beta [Acidiferrobacterales bacterium]|nr:glycine--tRNA ligase subunit beta [Acidiferrobacterales bacterium]
MSETLLIELGTEELPPKALRSLSDAFSKGIVDGLLDAQLIDSNQSDQAIAYATPRRLAISVPNVLTAQPDQTIERRGPAIKAAFKDDGEPSPAALGFAKSCGVEIADLQRLKTDKGEWLSYTLNESGKGIAELIQEIINQTIKRLPIPKRMRWGAGNAEFVRPAHWLIVMHGAQTIETSILDIQSSNITQGHRFHSGGELAVEHADHYATRLEEQGHVIANFEIRKAMIKQQILELANQVNGRIEDDEALLDEVTGLVEHPASVLGEFDEEFLDVPQECLISSMRDHQKYFHIIDKENKLLPNFITVSNIDSKDPQRVIQGNERVLRARLSDAQFFWSTDLKQKLESRVAKLESVLFHIKLGSVFDKSNRLQNLTKLICARIGANCAIAERAALLAKADLVSDMVGEFDSLQGLMGRYYANNDGEDSLIGDCIEQHYWPKFAGDQLPTSPESQAVALADRLDSLVGLFASGEIPTGDKDPYALRRAALGILRILIEQNHNLNLSDLVSDSAASYSALQNIDVDSTTQEQVVDFVRGRLTAHYQSQNIPTSTIHAVMACKPDSPLDFENRVKAITQFELADEAQDLAAANKRISNILKKQPISTTASVDESLLLEPAEKVLHTAICNIEDDCVALFEKGDYAKGLEKLSSLRTPVDSFFEDVMVMSEDPAQQQNRLALLAKLQQLFLQVADISLLQN